MEETNYDDSNNNNADNHDDDEDDHDDAAETDEEDAMDFDNFDLDGLIIFDHPSLIPLGDIESSVVVLDAIIALLNGNMPPEIYQRMVENREMYIRSQNSILTTFMSEEE